MKPSLVVSQVAKKWGNVVAVDNVSLEIRGASLTALLGPNGAGKTTLLNIVAGIVPPDRGSVEVCEIDVWKRPRDAKKILGFAPQDGGFDLTATVMENALYVASLYGINDKRRVREVLEAFGLWELRNRLASKLSGGEKKRLSIALSLIHDPEVLLLDEPTSGLDPGARRALMDLLRRLSRNGKLVLISTHIGSDAEECDKIVLMHRGRVMLYSSPSEAKDKVFGKSKIVELVIEGKAEGLSRKLGIEVVEGVARMKCIDIDECMKRIEIAASEVGARIVEMRIREPTVEDVFVELTGAKLG